MSCKPFSWCTYFIRYGILCQKNKKKENNHFGDILVFFIQIFFFKHVKKLKRGHKKIYLREAGQKKVREYLGKIIKVKLKEDTAFADKGDVLKKGKAKS